MTVLSLLRAVRSPPLSATITRLVALPSQALKAKAGSSLQNSIPQFRQLTTSQALRGGHGSERHFNITPSRYSWNQYKDQMHFYIMLGVIPGLMVVFFVNVFIGPATLAPIPEGCEPKHWEYYRHPISRWLARYFFTSHQEDYERNLFYIVEEEEKRKMRFLAWRVEELMAHRGDYPNYFVKPTILGKYLRYNIADVDYIKEIHGAADDTNIHGPLEK